MSIHFSADVVRELGDTYFNRQIIALLGQHFWKNFYQTAKKIYNYLYANGSQLQTSSAMQ